MDESSLAIGRLLRGSKDESRKERILRQIAARRRVPRARDVQARYALAAVAAASLIVGLFMGASWLASSDRDRTARGRLMVRGGGALSRFEVPEEASLSASYVLSDGSTISVQPGSVLTTTENDGQRLSLVLIRGEAVFDVVPSPRRWVVDAGLASVEVLGTQFGVDRSDEEVTIRVERGTVRVRSEHLGRPERLLHAGEVVRVPNPSPNPGEAAAEDREQNGADEEDEGQVSTEAASGARATFPWRDLARGGDYSGAYGQLGSEGLADQVGQARSIEELLLLADVARLSGHPRDAVAPLEQAISEHSGHRRAAVAAFTLGRIHADVLGDPARAAWTFERCLALGPPEALHANALARLAEARAESGDHDGAQRAAEDYLRRYPDGSRAGFLRDLRNHLTSP